MMGGLIPAFAKANNVALNFVIKDFLVSPEHANYEQGHVYISLDVDLFTHAPRKSILLAEFLRTTSVIIHRQVVTIREVIKAVANGKGGNHAKLKKGETSMQFLLDFDEVFFSGNSVHSLDLLFSIGRITLKALEPIVAAINARNQPKAIE